MKFADLIIYLTVIMKSFYNSRHRLVSQEGFSSRQENLKKDVVPSKETCYEREAQND